MCLVVRGITGVSFLNRVVCGVLRLFRDLSISAPAVTIRLALRIFTVSLIRRIRTTDEDISLFYLQCYIMQDIRTLH